MQSTLNVLTIYKLIRKLKELLLLIVDLLPYKELNNFKIVIPLRTPKSITQFTDAPAKLLDKDLEPIASTILPKS